MKRWKRPVPMLFFAAVLCQCATGPSRAPERPNIIVILADDMGYGDAGCYNPRSAIPTPHIDRLAREGMRFTDAHAPGSVCVPSRYGLLTGRYPARPRYFRPGENPVIEADRVTVASWLRDQGYTTAMVGKWHLGFEGGPWTEGDDLHGGPVDRGFDSFFGMHASLDIPPYYYIRGRTPVQPPSGKVAASHTEGWTSIQGAFWREGDCAPDFVHAEVLPKFIDEAVQCIEDQAHNAAPFFLYLALPAPHTPWLPDPAFDGTSDASMYGDFMHQVDAGVGDVLAALDRTGQADHTLVLFTSDNGPVWYPDDEDRFGHHSTGPWRGMKGDAWEGGHRMPFVVRWPDRVPAATVCDRTVCFTDVLATCADIAGAPLADGVGEDSVSLWPVLQDPDAVIGRTNTLLKANGSVVRAGRWKLITHLGSGGFSRPRRTPPLPGGPEGQLYDLETDPGETRNLWQDEPGVVTRLLAWRADLLRSPDEE